MKLWIARNNKGELRLFRWTPKYNNNLDMWYEEHLEDGYGNISNSEFPEVTLENSPQEVELKLVNELWQTKNYLKEQGKQSLRQTLKAVRFGIKLTRRVKRQILATNAQTTRLITLMQAASVVVLHLVSLTL